jgi:hypothetical protein
MGNFSSTIASNSAEYSIQSQRLPPHCQHTSSSACSGAPVAPGGRTLVLSSQCVEMDGAAINTGGLVPIAVSATSITPCSSVKTSTYTGAPSVLFLFLVLFLLVVGDDALLAAMPPTSFLQFFGKGIFVDE